MEMERARILITGATGFVGSHLHARLTSLGHDVIGATRRPEAAQRAHPGRSFRYLDVQDEASARAALAGVDVAVYLVHSMANSADYEAVEERAARTFAAAAAAAGVQRIVYLGGVQPHGESSRHLHSRLRTGEVLRAGEVPCIELQASMIIGAGSESFRIVRDLAARLPAMVLPRWLETRTEPIALDDVLAALTHALAMPATGSARFTLPGPEVMSGRQILERTAHLLGMHPAMIDVPLLTPRLSSYWIMLITRADKHVSQELVEGLRSDLLSDDAGFWKLLPAYRRMSFDEAVERALRDEDRLLGWRGRMVERAIHRLWARPAHASG
jgi:uncharacterized protein YbjT (DUF2867 family)